MANRVYLIQSGSSAPATYDPDKDILVASSNSIPVFWYALFESNSIIAKVAELKDASAATYPFLVTATAAAKVHFAERRAYMHRAFPQSFAPVFDDFERLLDTVETPHIHLETLELWMMDEPEKFLPHVETCLRAFALCRSEDSLAAPLSTPEWRELLDQVGMDADDIAGSIEPHKLTGYNWVRPVPWKDPAR